jgi:glycosyltransferase involved in cell wall biosynthesis
MPKKRGEMKMLSVDSISIIMPAFNAEKTITRAIESIQKQTYKNWQLIIVNDGSKDATQEIIQQKCREDSRIEGYLIENSGPAQARNYALEHAKGKWVAFCDADDWLTENALEIMVTFMNGVSFQLCACYYTSNCNNNEVVYLNKQKAIFQFLTNPEIGGYLWNKLFLRKLIEIDKIRFEKDIFICEDLLFVIRYASRIQNCVVVPRKLYNYDIQPNGLTSAAFSMKKVTQLDALEKIGCVLLDNNDKENLEIAKKLLVEKAIFIRRDATKAIRNGSLKRGTLEDKYIKGKTKKICRQYVKEYVLKSDFPIKFKGMMIAYCLV